jgi:NAD(P)-dependent dehydrogenase (short-subunit alcohol dehydrogenase family)
MEQESSMEDDRPGQGPACQNGGAMPADDAASRRGFLIGATAAMAGAALGPASARAEKVEATEPLIQGSGRLRGKTAVITGAARGIGRAIAEAFAAEGADVMGIDIAGPASAISEAEPSSRADLDETARRVQARGRRFIGIVADVRDMAALRDAAKRAEKEFGRVDILVPNAAIQTMKPLLEMNDLEWRDIIDVNLTGYANAVRAFAPMMVQKKSGRIIMIASRQGRQGWKNGSSYSASKWGVIGLMKSVSLEMAEHGITVNCVEPGLVDTPLTRNPTRLRGAVKETQHVETAPQNPPVDEVAKLLAKQNPMHIPWLQPQDIAPAVVFLASDEAYRISGATYDVTAGDSAHYTA